MSKTGSSLVRFTVSQSLKASTAVHVGGHHAPAAAEFNRLEAYPRIGKREVVGYGRNSDPSYFDAPDCPCPAVRWSEETEEIRKLREKAKGDWAALSIADKKACMTQTPLLFVLNIPNSLSSLCFIVFDRYLLITFEFSNHSNSVNLKIMSKT